MKRILVLCLLLTSPLLMASDGVTGWRTDGSGIYETAKPPLTWGPKEHIAWKTEMPDWSNAQAILVGDKLFTNAEPNSLVCLDAESGKILWTATSHYEDAIDEVTLAQMKAKAGNRAEPVREEKARIEAQMRELRSQVNDENRDALRGKIRGLGLKIRELDRKINEIDPLNLPAKHKDNGFTSAIPVSDGRHVVAVFGNGVASCFDLKGNRKWSVMLEKPSHGFGHSASPAISGDTVFVHILKLFALDLKTGEQRWVGESKEAWGSPVTTEIGGVPVVITAREGDVYRVSDGKKVGRAGGLEHSTPVILDGVLYLIEKQARAVKLPSKFSEEMTFEPLWKSRIKGSRHYASSLIHDGLIYAVSREGWMSLLDQKTGELIYEKRLDIPGDNRNSVYPSLAYAGGRVYIGFEEGVTLVLQPGREYKELARNNLERYRGTAIFHGKRVYLRGLTHMYCLEE